MTQNFNQGKKTNPIHRTLADMQIGLLMIITACFVFTPTIYSQSWSNTRLMTTRGTNLYTVETNGLLYRTNLTTGVKTQEGTGFNNERFLFSNGTNIYTITSGGDLVKQYPTTTVATGRWRNTRLLTTDGSYFYTIETSGELYRTNFTTGVKSRIGTNKWTGAKMIFAEAGIVAIIGYPLLYGVNSTTGAMVPAGSSGLLNAARLGANIDKGDLYTIESSGLYRTSSTFVKTKVIAGWADAAFMFTVGTKLYVINKGIIYDVNPATGNWFKRFPPASASPTPTPTPTPAGPAPGEQALWDTARQINTKAAYEQYLLSYPQGTYVKSANLALSALAGPSPTPTPTPGGDPIEAQYWAEVEKANTRDSYEKYLEAYPFGPHANQARIRIGFSGGASASPTPNQANDSAKKEKEQALWETVRALNTVDGYQDFIKNYPDGVYAESARILMKSAPSATPTPAPVAMPTPSPRVSADDEFWNKIKDSNRVADFEVYLQAFPGGDHRADAMLTISRLKPAKQEPPAEKLRECTVNGVVNLRDDSNNGKKIGTLSKGETVIFMEKDGSWTRVGENRRGRVVPLGWVFGTNLDCDP